MTDRQDPPAARDRARPSRAPFLVGIVVLALLVAIPAGILLARSRGPTPPAGSGAAEIPLVAPGTEVRGEGMIFQDGESPMICFASLDSYPPQCSGPLLAGEFSWDTVDHEEAAGIRWATQSYDVQGTFDPAAGPQGTLTLTQPVRPAEPDEADTLEFPQLCDDPLRGADPNLQTPEAANAMHDVLEQYDLVDVWVSNGVDAYNVVVRDDAETVHSALREVWGGKLCVQSSADATQAERIDAVERVIAALAPGQLISGGPEGRGGGIGIDVVYLDEESFDAIRAATGGIPTLVRTALTPLGTPSTVGIN